MEQTTLSVTAPTLSRRLATFFHAALFVLGFSFVFVMGVAALTGGVATTLGQLFGQYKTLLGQVGGAIVVVFGLATLRAILTLGFSQETAGPAMVLSSGYALGLGLPFLSIGLAMDRAADFARRFRRHLGAMQKASGVFLILIGLMMVTGRKYTEN